MESYVAVRAATREVALDLKRRLAGHMDKQGLYTADTSIAHLHWLMQAVDHHADEWPIDKLSRWVGFVQGVMAARGLLNVEEERNRTRPVFQAAYQADGINDSSLYNADTE